MDSKPIRTAVSCTTVLLMALYSKGINVLLLLEMYQFT